MNNHEDIDDSEMEFFAITDMDGYCQRARAEVGLSISPEATTKDLEEYISLGQLEKIVDDFCEDHDKDGSPIISEQTHSMILDAVMVRFNNVGIAKLAAQDMIQVAFDEELNDFVFWTT